MGEYRAGLVAVVGRPNVGKSTILNTIVGQKISIVSDKAQTTRRRLLGIHTRSDYQIVFADTPGLHGAKHKLGHILNETVRQSLSDVDCILVVVDVSRHPGKEDTELADLLQKSSQTKPVVLCMNKMDLLQPLNVQPHYDEYLRLFPTERHMMTSFTKHQNVDKLVEILVETLPVGPPFYPEDQVTDQSVRALSADMIREKVLRLTREEVPHAVATYVENWEETPTLARIMAVIMVETDGQKAIIIGKGGSMLKKLGTQARGEIEQLLDKKVYLELFVKVKTDWRQNSRLLHELELA